MTGERPAITTGHCRIIGREGDQRLICAYCGQEQPYTLPLPLDDWLALIRRFLATHRHCPLPPGEGESTPMASETCEITVRALGPDAARAHLTLEVQSPYHPAFVQALKSLPSDDRAWQEDTRRWWVAGRHRARLCGWAQMFPAAYLLEGRLIVNLHTGQRVEQLGLFDAGEP